jgi:hypothetical protein
MEQDISSGEVLLIVPSPTTFIPVDELTFGYAPAAV